MIPSKEFYNTGVENYYNAISFSKTNQFGEAITLNVISLSAEYLLSSMLAKHGIEHNESGLGTVLFTLDSNHLIPEDVKEKAAAINLQCTLEESGDSSKSDMDLLLSNLKEIKNWADDTFKSVPA